MPKSKNKSSSAPPLASAQEHRHHHLGDCVHHALNDYFQTMGNDFGGDLYEMVLSEVEKPLLTRVMAFTNNNQSYASQILGISRTTLRKKLQQYNYNNLKSSEIFKYENK